MNPLTKYKFHADVGLTDEGFIHIKQTLPKPGELFVPLPEFEDFVSFARERIAALNSVGRKPEPS